MAAKPSGTNPAQRSMSGPEDVAAFLASLDHPFKQEILALRQIILGADPSITEAIKWNAPSFRTSEHFATFQLRTKEGVLIILHLGAKTRPTTTSGIAIADPTSLLEWLAKDRASVLFRTMGEIAARQSAFTDILRQWVTYV